jgi:hypothetical protein
MCANGRPRRGGAGYRPRRRCTSRSAHGPPSRQDDDPHEPALACPRCGSGVVVFRGICTCATCWAETVLALESA